MKGENLIQAIVGGVVAGVAFGAGFAIANKGMAKIGKGIKKEQDKIDEDLVTTRPMELPAGEMSNLSGKGLVHSDSWSNGFGLSPRQSKRRLGGGVATGMCKEGGYTTPVASQEDCQGTYVPIR